jgi:hypothetical protein
MTRKGTELWTSPAPEVAAEANGPTFVWYIGHDRCGIPWCPGVAAMYDVTLAIIWLLVIVELARRILDKR